MFLYYLAGRVVPCFIELARPIELYDGETQSLSNSLLSNVLMLDMCPMMAFVMPLLAIFEKKRKILSYIAPIAFFAGFLSIFGGVFKDFDGGWTVEHGNPFKDGYVVHFTAQYIFIGNSQDHLFFMMHIFIITLGLMTMLTTDQKLKWNTIGSLSCVGVMAVYAAILAYSLKIESHAFGVVWGDWKIPDGEFSAVTSVVGNNFAIPVGFLLGGSITAINIVGFYFIRRIKIRVITKQKKVVNYKPFGDLNNVSLVKPEQITKMWKVNWKLQ